MHYKRVFTALTLSMTALVEPSGSPALAYSPPIRVAGAADLVALGWNVHENGTINHVTVSRAAQA